MSGNNESLAMSQMEAIDKALDEYEGKIGLPNTITAPGDEDELNEYLNMERNVIEALSSVECASIAVRLQQFAFYIQRLLNRETARANWANATLASAVAPKLNSYDKYAKYEVKVELAASENNYVSKLLSISKYAERRKDRLFYLASSIASLSKALEGVKQAKISERYNG